MPSPVEPTPAEPTTVQAALAEAFARWPAVRVTEAALTAHLAQIGALPEAVASNGADLVLACACARGDSDALYVFETVHVSGLASQLTRLQLSEERLTELQQLLRVKLFTGSPPRILRYAGKGPLGAWVRVLSIRLAVDEMRAETPTAQLDARTVESFMDKSVGAEDRMIRARWQPLLREAVEAGLAALPTGDKTLLRLHYIEELSIGAIGVVYQVHRATVARWLLAIRERVMTDVRARLSLTLRPTTSEMRGVLGELQGDLQISISRVLGTTPDPEAMLRSSR